MFAARLSVSKQCRKRYAVVVNLFIKYPLSNRAWGSGCYHIYAKLIRVKISGTRAAIFNPSRNDLRPVRSGDFSFTPAPAQTANSARFSFFAVVLVCHFPVSVILPTSCPLVVRNLLMLRALCNGGRHGDERCRQSLRCGFSGVYCSK